MNLQICSKCRRKFLHLPFYDPMFGAYSAVLLSGAAGICGCICTLGVCCSRSTERTTARHLTMCLAGFDLLLALGLLGSWYFPHVEQSGWMCFCGLVYQFCLSASALWTTCISVNIFVTFVLRTRVSPCYHNRSIIVFLVLTLGLSTFKILWVSNYSLATYQVFTSSLYVQPSRGMA